MNLVLILSFAALVITISSSTAHSNNSSALSPPNVNNSDGSLGDSRTFDVFRYILGYIQTGLSFLLGRDEKPSRGTGRKSEKNKINYHGYQVFRIKPKSDVDVEDLEALPDDIENIQFWTRPAKRVSTDIMVAPESIDEMRLFIREKDMDYEMLINDVQKVIAYENPRMTKEQREVLIGKKGHPMTWSRYHRYNDMLRYFEFLVFAFPNLVELITIGYSTRGLPLKVVKVSTDSRGELEPDEEKPAVWIDGGMHGREWITSSVVLYILKNLVEKYEVNKRLVDNADWYLMPVANPDGYEYSHTTDRLWAKSRSNHDNSAADFTTSLLYGTCEGVNMDYNYDFHWGELGSSDDPCSDFYAGPRPFSEPETRAITDFILDKRDQFRLFLSLHSYSQQWLIPWSYSKKKVEDYDELATMARKAVDALAKVSGTVYDVSTSSSMRSADSGSSADWAKGAAGVKYSYKVELRDRGTYGYLLPATQIIPTARETFVAIKAMAKSIVCKS